MECLLASDIQIAGYRGITGINKSIGKIMEGMKCSSVLNIQRSALTMRRFASVLDLGTD